MSSTAAPSGSRSPSRLAREGEATIDLVVVTAPAAAAAVEEATAGSGAARPAHQRLRFAHARQRAARVANVLWFSRRPRWVVGSRTLSSAVSARTLQCRFRLSFDGPSISPSYFVTHRS